MLYLPIFYFVMDDDPRQTASTDTHDLSSCWSVSLGSRSNSNSHLTADGPGEFWCPVCGQRCTSNLTTGIEYGHALDCPERGPNGANRAQATEARQTSGGGGSDGERQSPSQSRAEAAPLPWGADPTGGFCRRTRPTAGPLRVCWAGAVPVNMESTGGDR